LTALLLIHSSNKYDKSVQISTQKLTKNDISLTEDNDNFKAYKASVATSCSI